MVYNDEWVLLNKINALVLHFLDVEKRALSSGIPYAQQVVQSFAAQRSSLYRIKAFGYCWTFHTGLKRHVGSVCMAPTGNAEHTATLSFAALLKVWTAFIAGGFRECRRFSSAFSLSALVAKMAFQDNEERSLRVRLRSRRYRTRTGRSSASKSGLHMRYGFPRHFRQHG